MVFAISQGIECRKKRLQIRLGYGDLVRRARFGLQASNLQPFSGRVQSNKLSLTLNQLFKVWEP